VLEAIFLVNCPIFERNINMRIMYINNDGGGFADYVEAQEGNTVAQFFKDKMPGREASDYLIRVNRQPVPRDYVLQEGDRVTVTPTKIEGALVA
jgi:sulfur carrier protein ThiS